MEFFDSLKKWFYKNNSHAASASARIPLLDASGNPIGSDTMANLASVLGGWRKVDFRTIQDATEKDLDRIGIDPVSGYGFRLGWCNTSNTSLFTGTTNVGFCIDFDMYAQIIFSYSSDVHVFRFRNGTSWVVKQI